jgi:hypothetical protein
MEKAKVRRDRPIMDDRMYVPKNGQSRFPLGGRGREAWRTKIMPYTKSDESIYN